MKTSGATFPRALCRLFASATGCTVELLVQNTGTSSVTLDEQMSLHNALTSFSVVNGAHNSYPVSSDAPEFGSLPYQDQTIAPGAMVSIAEYFIFVNHENPAPGTYILAASPIVQLSGGPAVSLQTGTASFTF